MKLQFFWLAGIALLCSQCSSPTPPPAVPPPALAPRASTARIPDSWVEKIRRNKYQKSSSANVAILKELETYISSDTVDGTSEKDHYQDDVAGEKEPGGRFNALFVNLDEDADEEIVGVFGYARHTPSLGVFKKVDGGWRLLYRESFFLFNAEPELQVANNYSANKVFYVRQLQERGSGIYMDSYCFYKLINGKVYPCLQLVNEANIYGWGQKLNQTTSSKFSFNSTTADELWVNYRYAFFAGPVEKQETSWHPQPEISFVKDEQGVAYTWNERRHLYQPRPDILPDGLNDFRLTADKIACFSSFGNDTLFVRAFAHELKATLNEGDKQQKQYLKQYLAEVQAKKK